MSNESRRRESSIAAVGGASNRIGAVILVFTAALVFAASFPFGRGRVTVALRGSAAIPDLPAPALVIANPGYVGPRVCRMP